MSLSNAPFSPYIESSETWFYVWGGRGLRSKKKRLFNYFFFKKKKGEGFFFNYSYYSVQTHSLSTL